MSSQKQITAEVASLKIRTKKHLYQGLINLQFYLPPLESPIITKEFLIDVRFKNTFCPSYEQIKIKPCLRPPSTVQAQAIVVEAMQKFIESNRNKSDPVELARYTLFVEYLSKSVAEKQWYLAILSTLEPNSPVFQAHYLPKPREEPKQEAMVDNSDGLFEALPLLNSSEIRRGKRFSFDRPTAASREQKLVDQIARLT